MGARETEWGRPPGSPRLGQDEVHVWRVYLNQTSSTRRRLFETLSADERGRAARYHFEADREAFVVGRGLLRSLLGRYLGLTPAAIRFDYSRYGKPSLAAGTGGDALQFNVSHSHRVALYALTRSRRVGVDVELLNERHASAEVAERFFSAAEAAALRALPPGERTLGFFNCWTRKEAYIKALGEGLSHPLQGFTVSLKPGAPAMLLEAAGDSLAVSHWVFRELLPGPLYVGALAVEGPPASFRLWRWAADES
jgi:4'-phosphopantetheinyl transferase